MSDAIMQLAGVIQRDINNLDADLQSNLDSDQHR
jgi:hypothetical protein